MPQGGARGQNVGRLAVFFFVFFCFYLSLICNHSYLKNRYYSGLTSSL